MPVAGNGGPARAHHMNDQYLDQPGFVSIRPGSGGDVRCSDCAHHRPVSTAPWLSLCSAGVPASCAAGNWSSDPRICDRFAPHHPGTEHDSSRQKNSEA